MGVTNRNIGTKKPIFKILLWNWKAWRFDILYVASPWGPLPCLFIKYPWGQNWPRPGGSQVEHRNKEQTFYNSFSLKLYGLELWYFVCSISLGTSTKFVNKMPVGSKLAPPWGSQVEHRNKERKFYNSSSLKLDGLELWYFVCSISMWTSTKFIHMMPQGSGLVLPWGLQVGA